MKKLLLPLIFAIILYSCSQDNSGDKENKTDSTQNTAVTNVEDDEQEMDFAKICNITVNLKKWEIDKGTGDSMIAYFKVSQGPQYDTSKIIKHRSRIFNKLACLYGYQNVAYVQARYRGLDTLRYQDKRGLARGNPNGSVAKFNTWIIWVNQGTRLLDDIHYYDCVSICPPPDPCPNESQGLMNQ
jgi:hypothetical protein